MPVTPTYPGVYIEEVPSGVRTIAGVATSITAFIGRALRGPVDEPVTINSFADFERRFGGLWVESPMGYAVRDFYLNGGGQAIIVRLNRDAGTAELPVGELKLTAASPGSWGNRLGVVVDHDVSADAAERLGLTADDLFNLVVMDDVVLDDKGQIKEFRNREEHRNLTIVDGSPRRIDRVLAQGSQLVRASSLGATRPEATTYLVLDEAKVSDGASLKKIDLMGKEGDKKGLYALEKTDLFNLLCIPPYAEGGDLEAEVWETAATYCERRRAMLIIDPPSGWISKDKVKIGDVGGTSKNAALFFPRLRQPNPLRDNQVESFAPCGAVAGVIARIDGERGVWKAPAGLDATLRGVRELSVPLTDAENGELNPLGINCLRSLPAVGPVVWGARTRQGDDRLASEWKYLPVRRLALYIEESLYRGTQWVVFEENDEPLWAQVRLNVGAFLNGLFRQGAFQGSSPRDAYFVKCDRDTTTQDDVNRGVVNILVGFAPLKPAEFVIIKIQQMAGQIAA